MAQLVCSATSDDVHVRLEMGMVDRMHTCRHTGTGCCTVGQLGHQLGVGRFLAHGGPVFTVQGDVEYAGAELGHHLGLQLQAFAHAHVHAAVVIADRQPHCATLGVEQNFGGMNQGSRHDLRCATMKSRGKASRRLPSARTG